MDTEYEKQLSQCFKYYDNIPSNIPSEIIEIVEKNKDIKRQEIIKNLEEYKLKKLFGSSVKIIETPLDTRKDKVVERLQKRLEDIKMFK